MTGQEIIELLKPFSGKEIEFLPIENGTKIELWVDGGDEYVTTVDAVKTDVAYEDCPRYSISP